VTGSDQPAPGTVVDPSPVPGGEPSVVWVAPGSSGTEDLRSAWHRGDSALRTHRGPLGAVLTDRDGAIVLATDPLGTMPLYWARNEAGAIVVDTNISRIVDRPDVDDRLDLEGVVLTSQPGLRGDQAADRTAFRAVRVVPAGSTVRFRPDGTWQTRRHWSPSGVAGPDERLTFDDCVEALRAAVDGAIRDAVATDRHLGAHVSGGLDCTSVACRAQLLLAEQGRSLVAGYSWAPSEDDVPRFAGDERALLDDVEREAGFPVHRAPHRDTTWWFRRDPNRFPSSTHATERHIIQLASDHGVQVMLSGWGGDELASFNGRSVWTYLIRRGEWSRVLAEQRRQRSLTGTRPSVRTVAQQLLGTAVRALPHPVDQLRHPVATWRQHQADLEWEAELRSFSPLVADLAAEQRTRVAHARDPRSYQEALLGLGHLQHRIQAWHQVGSIFGLTYRYPLLDVRVVETALRMPWWAWRHDGWSRAAYRAAVAPWVPASVAWNLRKVEPAFFQRPGAEPRVIEEPPPDAWRSTDPGYDIALGLARGRRRLTSRPAWSPDQRVEARTDRAL
jgi:asparagine synthase (glutamine-hydrolysing)